MARAEASRPLLSMEFLLTIAGHGIDQVWRDPLHQDTDNVKGIADKESQMLVAVLSEVALVPS